MTNVCDFSGRSAPSRERGGVYLNIKIKFKTSLIMLSISYKRYVFPAKKFMIFAGLFPSVPIKKG